MDFIELIKTVLLSLIFILLIHTIFNYFKDNFTEQKRYDYLNAPDEKYKDIYNKINSEQPEPSKDIVTPEVLEKIGTITDDGTTNISDLSSSIEEPPKKQDMKDQLKMFLKGVQKNEVSGYQNQQLSNNEI
jgi:hypothetical protein